MGKLEFLKTDQDFEAFRASKSFQTAFLKIRVHFRSNQNNPRFGFIIPKKVVPKVVDRNFLKRRIKAILAQISKDIKGADIIFYPQKGQIKKSFQNVFADIKELFTKAKLWKQ